MVFKIFRFIAETAILHVAFTLQDPRLQSLSKYFQIVLVTVGKWMKPPFVFVSTVRSWKQAGNKYPTLIYEINVYGFEKNRKFCYYSITDILQNILMCHISH